MPALALAFDPANKDVMKRKPVKPGKGIFTKGMTLRIIYQGIMIGTITLIAFCIGLGTPGVEEHMKIKVGQTMAFCVLALSQLVHVFNICLLYTSHYLYLKEKMLLLLLLSHAFMD